MMDETGPVNVHALYTFRGTQYAVTVVTSQRDGDGGGERLTVQVDEQESGDQWRSEFDVNYIEDLTHKTGNYKQFNIFVNMLETALTKSSDAVSLDLLTYSDLESLRNRRHGSRPGSSSSKSSLLNTKRYLILTYTVEFDRIHYPLPLAYQGKPDPRTLQETVRQLRGEISQLKSSQSLFTQSQPSEDYEKLKADYSMLLDERDQLDEEFQQYRRDCKPNSKQAKELRMLRSMVKHLEDELSKERNKCKKITAKKAAEYKQLMDELDESRAAERNLRVRVKNLTNELAFYKRNRVHDSPTRSQSERKPSWSISQSADRKPVWARQSRARSWSRDRSRERDVRSSSRDRAVPWRNEASPKLRESQERLRRVRSSQERARASQERVRSSQERRSQDRSFRAPLRSRSPSPGAYSNKPRFDPTAYVKEKKRKQQEAEMKSSREIRSSQGSGRVSGSSPGYVNSVRRSSGGGRRFFPRSASVESLSGDENSSMGRLRRFQRSTKSQEPSLKRRDRNAMPPPRPGSTQSKKARFTPEPRDPSRRQAEDAENIPPNAEPTDYLATTDEISEIDARLKRLQHYMASNMMIK